MRRSRIIGYGLICLLSCIVLRTTSAADVESELAILETLLDDPAMSSRDAQIEPAAQSSRQGAAENPSSAHQAALARIAALEQLLRDRDAIIVQLSSAQASVAGADTNEDVAENNARLTEALDAMRIERDQIRQDVARLLEENMIAREAPSGDTGVAELEEVRQVVEALRQALEASESERVASDEALVVQARDFEKQLKAAAASMQELTAAAQRSERLRAEAEALLTGKGGERSEGELAQELSSLRVLDASRRVAMDELLLQIGKLRDTLATREEALGALHQKNSDLEQEIAVHTQQLAEYDSAVAALQDAQTSKDQLLREAHGRIETQAAEMRQLESSLEDQAEALRLRLAAHEKLEEQHAAGLGDLLALQAQVEDRADTISQLRRQLAQQEAALASLRQDYERALAVDVRRRQLLDETLASLADVENRESTLKAKHEALQATVVTVERARDDLQADVATLEQQVASLEEQAASGAESNIALRASLEARDKALIENTSAHIALQDEHYALTDEVSVAKEENAGLLQEVEKLRGQLVDSRAALEAVASELDSIKLVDDRRRRTLDETLAHLAVAEQQAQQYQARLAAAEGRLLTAEDDLRMEIASLSERNGALQDELDQKSSDLKRALTAVATGDSGDSERSVLAGQVVELEKRNATLVQEAQAAKNEVVRLQELLASDGAVDVSAPRDLALLQQQLRDREAAAELATARLATLAAALEETKAKMTRMAAENEMLAPDTSERVAALRDELARVRDELASVRRTDIRETDLYRELEENSALLREQLVQTEAERQRLQRTAEELRAEAEGAGVMLAELRARESASLVSLADTKKRELEYQDLLDRLVPEIRMLEETVTELRHEREALGARLLQREDDMAALRVELDKREHRLARAERVADVLERTRSEVEQTQKRQRLNMHYNMAAVYARDGRFAEAEQEYLQALRLEPGDRDVHFNLGILYDDELAQPEKALLHYRRYLQLNPHGEDADRVRSWVMRLEMQQGR